MPFFASMEFCSCCRVCRDQLLASSLAVDSITHLVRKHALDSLNSSSLVLGKDLLDAVRDLPVLSSRLHQADRDLGGLVGGGEEGGADVGHGESRGRDDDAMRGS